MVPSLFFILGKLSVSLSARHVSCLDAEEEGEGEEERKQEAVEWKEAGAASRGIQGRGLSQEKDDEDDLPDESSAKRRSSKVNKKKGGDQ